VSDAGTTHHLAPGPQALADAELLVARAFAPLDGFLGSADVDSVRARRRLADGRPWPVPLTLDVPADLAGGARPGDEVLVEDPEGTPIAAVRVDEVWEESGTHHVAGPVEPRRRAAFGVFRRLHLTPAQARRLFDGDRPVLAVLADAPLHRDRLEAVRRAATARDARVLLLVPTADDRELPPESLVRLAFAARDELGEAAVVAVRLARRADPVDDLLLTAHVAAAYGAGALLTASPDPGGAAVELVPPEPVGYDAATDTWRPVAGAADLRAPLDDAAVRDLLDAGEPLPEWFTPPGVAAELRHVRPPLDRRGLTVFFTGLSGSGKSTLARALRDALVERADRTVTYLDGDVVRRMLSAGLGFSREDRDRNILRIGYVAAEACRHGGIAICAPIAPYAATRAEVRRMVTAAGGGFVLVHAAASLEVCEARDRKGLYAKARAGLISEFTGISDPYEEPTDAELSIDTGTVPVQEALREVLTYLSKAGWLSGND
jgi:sulfate adenylyltransferase